MNRYSLLCLVVTVLLSAGASHALAQPPNRGSAPSGEISGRVVGADGKSLSAATVSIMSARDSSLVTGAIAANDGTFHIEGLRPGRYLARVSYVGFKTHIVGDIAITPRSMSVALGDVRLDIDELVGEEVRVRAEREFMSVDADRTIYNVRDQPITKGGSATDVLRNIPSVEVDVDGNVSLRGSENVVVQINGRPVPLTGDALASYLESLPAGALQRIEVVPNPSAKYDPEGMSGILNIVLADNTDAGLSGSIEGGIGTLNTYSLGGSLTYGTGPWNLFTSYGFRSGDRNSEGSHRQENFYLDPMTTVADTSHGDRSRTSHSLNTTVDYDFDKQNSLSLSTILGIRDGGSSQLTDYMFYDSAFTPYEHYDRSSDEDRSNLDADIRLGFAHVVSPSENEIHAELRYSWEKQDEDQAYHEMEYPIDGAVVSTTPAKQLVTQTERNQDGALQVDIVHPVGVLGKLETGYKGSIERDASTFYSSSYDYGVGEFRPDVNLNNDFVYDEQIHAVYALLDHTFGTLSLQAGLRGELAVTKFDLTTTGESFDHNYTSIFPSANVAWKPTEGQQLKASYSRRVNRPRRWMLNPFGDYDDPLFVRVGNPYLDPEYTDAIEIGYTNFTRATTFTVSPYYRNTTNSFERVERLDTGGVTVMTWDNFASNESYGFEAIASVRLGSWLNAYANFNAYKFVADASNLSEDFSSSDVSWSARGNATVTMPFGTAVQLSYFYRAPRAIAGGEVSSFSSADLAITQKLFDDRVSIGLRVHDLFDQTGFSAERTTEQYHTAFSHRWGSRQAMLTVSYNFGRQDRHERRQRSNGDDSGGEDMQEMP